MGPKRRLLLSPELVIPWLIGTVIWLLILLYWRSVGFSIYVGDLKGYIDWSYHLSEHTDYASHMPAYPFLLLVGRLLTFRWFPDTFVAQCLGYLTWVYGLLVARSILARVAPDAMKAGLLWFALFPFLGVWAAANPVADLLAYAVVLTALMFALEKRFVGFALSFGLGLFTHQAFYPCYGALVLVCLRDRMPARLLTLCAAPFVLYYAATALQKHDWNWILSYHVNTHAGQPGGLPVFDGLLGTLLRGGAKNAFKAALLLGAFSASIALCVYCARRKNWLLVTLCVPALIAGLFSTQHVAWVIFRLAKLLLIPACWWLVKHPRALGRLNDVRVYAALAVALSLSQFFWARYNILYAFTHQ
jgi:hypothetical protein